MNHRHQAGHATGSLVLLLLVQIVAGGWNYHRNWQAERAILETRPYVNYSVKDLESLRDAYASELSGVQAAMRVGRGVLIVDQTVPRRTQVAHGQASFARVFASFSFSSMFRS